LKVVSLIIYPGADQAETKQFFRELIGADPYVDSAQYVGFKSGDMEIGLVPQAYHRVSGALAFWTVTDIAASVKALVDAGGTIVQEIMNVGGGLQVASVKDPNGNAIGLRQFPQG